MNLIACLKEVKDPRRLQGQRYNSVSMLLIIIMSILRNKCMYREMGRFCKLNALCLTDKFGFKNGKVPSCVSIRSFILSADFVSIQAAFHQRAKSYVQTEAGEWLSIAGKSIRSTVAVALTGIRILFHQSVCFAAGAGRCCTWKNWI